MELEINRDIRVNHKAVLDKEKVTEDISWQSLGKMVTARALTPSHHA